MSLTTELVYITHDRLAYTRITLPRVLDAGGDVAYSVRIVDNASTDGTREYLRALEHPRISAIVLNDENVGISPVTNALWAESGADLVGKVDNDILLPDRWLEPIVAVHERADPRIGVVGLCHFHRDEIDALDPAAIAHNVKTLDDGTRVFVQSHLGGACYALRRDLALRSGGVEVRPGVPRFGWARKQRALSKRGHVSCYVYPWVTCSHLGDERYPESDPALDPPEGEAAITERTKRHQALLLDPAPGQWWDSLDPATGAPGSTD